jgi:hypothetical protein
MKLITKLAGVAAVATLAVSGAVAAAGPALARPQVTHGATATLKPATLYYNAVSPISHLGCRGELDANDTAGPTKWYARGYFSDTGASCSVWLERSTNGGKSWYMVSAEHHLDSGDHVTTHWYWDGAGYLARVCIDPTFPTASCSASF